MLQPSVPALLKLSSAKIDSGYTTSNAMTDHKTVARRILPRVIPGP
jgi:hypothetical protein